VIAGTGVAGGGVAGDGVGLAGAISPGPGTLNTALQRVQRRRAPLGPTFSSATLKRVRQPVQVTIIDAAVRRA